MALEGSRKGRRSPGLLTNEEEESLSIYINYMSNKGLPVTRKIVKLLAKEIVLRRGGEGTVTEPSDGWLQRFFSRKNLSMRVASVVDGGRANMAKWSIIEQYFSLLGEQILGNRITSEGIFNIDETGFGEGQYRSRAKSVCSKGKKHPYIRHSQTRDHTSVLLCASADGTLMPPFIIFQNAIPHLSSSSLTVPKSLYASTETGYINSKLYIDFIHKVFIPHLPSQRPVILLQDNLSAHMSLELIKTCIDHQIILLNFPPHTTHILQPLDMLFDTLKSHFTSIARTASLLRENLTITKPKFIPVLTQALKSLTPDKITTAFRNTGIHPLNKHAIDKTKLLADSDHPPTKPAETPLPDTPQLCMTCDSEPPSPTQAQNTATEPQGTNTAGISSSSSHHPLQSSCTQTSPILGHCSSCNTDITTNPLVEGGLIPSALAQVLWVPPSSKTNRKRKRIKAQVLTAEEYVNEMERDLYEKEEKERIKLIKREERENIKIAKEIEQEERRRERERKKSNAKKTINVEIDADASSDDCESLCMLCLGSDPPQMLTPSKFQDINWITCEFCDKWFHTSCAQIPPFQHVYFCEACLRK